MKFNELNLPTYMLNAIDKQGFTDATEIQEKCIPLILNGKDVIGKSVTGSGKTFAYGLPLIEMVNDDNFIQGLVVCPTRELALQVCDELKKVTVAKESCKIVPIYGGSDITRQVIALKRSAKIVVGTPGRIMDHLRRKTLNLTHLKMLVLDEADEMLNMGFKEDIETILKSTNSSHQTVMFSATMPRPILEITKAFMKEPIMIEIGRTNETASKIKQYFVCHDKNEALVKLMEIFKPKISIVFCNTKAMVEVITKYFNHNGMNAVALHGDMRQSARKKAINDIKTSKTQVLVGTDVAARGLDVKNVDIVFNYDIPYDIEYYIHRIGRTARAGSEGVSFTLIANKKQSRQISLIKKETNSVIEQYNLGNDEIVELSDDTKNVRLDENRRKARKPDNRGYKKSESRSSYRGNDTKRDFKSSYNRGTNRESNHYDNLDDTNTKQNRNDRNFNGKTFDKNDENCSFKPRSSFSNDHKSSFNKFKDEKSGFKKEYKSFDKKLDSDTSFKPKRSERNFNGKTFDKNDENRSFKPRSSFDNDKKLNFDENRSFKPRSSFSNDHKSSFNKFKDEKSGFKKEYSSFDKKLDGDTGFKPKRTERNFNGKTFDKNDENRNFKPKSSYGDDKKSSFNKFKGEKSDFKNEHSSFDKKSDYSPKKRNFLPKQINNNDN